MNWVIGRAALSSFTAVKNISSPMASFEKLTAASPPPALAPKPIAAAAAAPPAFTRDRFFSHGNEEEEEEEEEEEDEGEEEEDDGIGRGANGVGGSIDLAKIRADSWSSHSGFENALALAGRDPCYARAFNLVEGQSSSSGQNDHGRGESNGCGFSGQEDGGYWDLLRSHLSDPVTGALMDDAMILTCGHSYGKGGMQQVYIMKACCKCSQPISEDSVRPNFALRSAVQAFRREEEMHLWKILKRKRDQFEQENFGHDDTLSNDFLRNKASLFPLSISDRVMIKGNKRTPPRFVGRVAVVTAQCLNGWYVVKTLDNGESVKLQFGSLARVSSDQPTSAVPTRANYPNWL